VSPIGLAVALRCSVYASGPACRKHLRAAEALDFTHSLRSLLLHASMYALSVGLPGREKSSVTPRW
jgi:hypothetical protein